MAKPEVTCTSSFGCIIRLYLQNIVSKIYRYFAVVFKTTEVKFTDEMILAVMNAVYIIGENDH